jgi:hypothetical protein
VPTPVAKIAIINTATEKVDILLSIGAGSLGGSICGAAAGSNLAAYRITGTAHRVFALGLVQPY